MSVNSFKLGKLLQTHILLIIIILGILVYGRMLFNGIVGDDTGYLTHPYIQQFQLSQFFTSGSADLGGSSAITGLYYRPLMLVVLSLLYKLFGNIYFFYHLPQLILHLCNVILLFYLFKRFFRESLAGLLAVLYLIHPINVETVAYLSDFQDLLFVFFGLLALNSLLYRPTKYFLFFVVPTFLLLSLLSKETGVLFIGSILLYAVLFIPNRIKHLLPSLLVIILVYSFLRFILAGVGIEKVQQTIMSTLPLSTRLVQIPEVILYYFKTLIFPSNLAIAQTWVPNSTILHLALPLLLITFFLFLITTHYLRLRRDTPQKARVFLFFFLWLGTGLSLHLQILPLEMTVADRWFYFPFIGALGMLGIVLTGIKLKDSKLACIIGILVIIFLSARTIIRLGDWKDSITLYEHDSTITKSYLLEHSYGYELLQRNNFPEAKKHLYYSYSLFPTTQNTNSLGVYFFKTHDKATAEKWFLQSIALGDNYLAYNNLIQLHLLEKSYDKAQKILQIATAKFPTSERFWYLLALTEYQRGKNAEAIVAIEKAYSLSPTQQNEYVMTELQLGRALKIND